MKVLISIFIGLLVVGCGKGSSRDTALLNVINAKQGLELEVARLKAENAKLKAALAGKNQPAQANVPQKLLPDGILSMDSKGRPTFSSLKPEAAVQFYDGMHLDRIKQLYGMPSIFKTTTIAKMKCHFLVTLCRRASTRETYTTPEQKSLKAG